MADVLVVTGILGRIEFDGQVVTVVTDRFRTPDWRRRRVALDSIERVDLKPGTRLFHGYLQVVVRGEPPAAELRGLFLGGRPPMTDPLSMSIKRATNPAAARLRAAVKTAMRDQPAQ